MNNETGTGTGIHPALENTQSAQCPRNTESHSEESKISNMKTDFTDKDKNSGKEVNSSEKDDEAENYVKT